VAVPLAVMLAVTALPGLGLAGAASAAAGAASAAAGPALPWPSNPDWEQYEQAPASQVVYPAKVIDVRGDVTNPSALTDPTGRSGTTTLSVPRSGPRVKTSLVLDYGKETGGWPEFDITQVSGSPELLAGYSEALRFLTPHGDGANGGPPGVIDPKRYDIYDAASPGVIANQFVQGGERYEELSLLTPGTISLSFARLRYARFLPSSSDEAQAYFVSSDPLLNRLWYDGAWTVNLDELALNTPTADWVANDGSVTVDGGTVDGGSGILTTGQDWTDYTTTFQTSILSGQAGWVVRARKLTTNDLLILGADDDTAGPPNTLQELVDLGGSYHRIANIRLPFTVRPETWYRVQTVADGPAVTTYINGRKVGSFSPGGALALRSGTVGFREGVTSSGVAASAAFRDLVVTGSGRAYTNPLDLQADVGAFELPVWNISERPLMIADAKRESDQGIWSGDLSVEGPTDYYSTGAPQFMRGALELQGSYQLSNGFVTGYVPATWPINTKKLPPRNGFNEYSASYSMYWVVDLAQYYEFTGDKAFVTEEWPIVEKELAWDSSQVNNGLLATNKNDGLDWHYALLTGKQTYENALYYQTLLDAAMLATAAGHPELAPGYLSQAQALKAAINQHMFDPAAGYYNISYTSASTSQAGPVAQDANVLPLLLGIVPPDRVADVVNALQTRLDTPYGALDVSSPSPGHYRQLIGPFMGSYELWALLANGYTSDALSLMSSEWGPMTTGDPGDTFWEYKQPDGQLADGYVSLAHGWSTGPTSALSQYILGVAPVGAGFSSWLVAPQPGPLSWAEGKVPTPYGPVTVKWGQRSGTFTMDVQAPASTTGTITVPGAGRAADITVNGHLVWSDGKFHPAPGVTGARLQGQDIDLAVTPKSAPAGFLITSVS
jgi:alpha-L-rhamnosidase